MTPHEHTGRITAYEREEVRRLTGETFDDSITEHHNLALALARARDRGMDICLDAGDVWFTHAGSQDQQKETDAFLRERMERVP